MSKINCVVMRGVNDDEVGAFASLAANRPLHVRFIEVSDRSVLVAAAWRRGSLLVS